MAGGRTALGLSLPPAGPEYDQRTLQTLIDHIRELEALLYLRNTHLEVYSPAGAGGRQPLFILRSPDDERWSITVDNSGNLVTTNIPSSG